MSPPGIGGVRPTLSEGHLDPKQWLGGSANRFILKIRGDSMVDDGIMDGDYVLVEPCTEIPHNKIAVVLLGDEATVKRVRIEGRRVALIPANRAAGYRTRYVRKNDPELKIIGRVRSCFRSFS